ncbi:MAG: hypothetical protein ACKVPY_13385 [Paracoccaceae bacterium]
MALRQGSRWRPPILDHSYLRDVSAAINDIAATIAIVLGAGWALWRFVLFREAKPRIEFDVGFSPVIRQGGMIVIEVEATLTNKGQVRHFIDDFQFDLLFLLIDDEVAPSESPKVRGQTHFRKRHDGQQFVTSEMEWTFVDPGITQRYSYVTEIPGNSVAVLMIAKFRYRDESDFHSAQRVWALAAQETPASAYSD